jgi:hypothetical protein
MPVSPSDIRNVVTKEDDFGHELRVGRVIRGSAAIQVEHGGTYTDPVTQKPRQFDYRCCLRKGSEILFLAVECKNLSPAVPLVVCGIKRQEIEAFHDIIQSRLGFFTRGSSVVSGASSVTRRASRENAFYPSGNFTGKSLVRIQTDKTPMVRSQDSDVYDKWAQAISSAVELAKSACDCAKKFGQPTLLASVIPLVVLPDGLLWKVEYDDNGNVPNDPTQITGCEIFVGRQIEAGGEKGTPFFHWFTFSHVHFFTVTGFGSFLSAITGESVWRKLFTPEAVEI